MKTSLVIFATLCTLVLLVTVLPQSEAFKELLDLDLDLNIDKRFKKKLAKKLLYMFLLTGNKKIYAVPVPLPIPIPILKKLQPIIYKEGVPVPYEVPVPYPVHHHGHHMGGGYGHEGLGGLGGGW
ncbi:hypothetical protein HDE_13794 [Halotydeus destructor]|nr:hypothetical protein HDE_13794 [Halotydeus destructor]